MVEVSPLNIPSIYDDLQAVLTELRKAAPKVIASRNLVEKVLSSDKLYYGINTGFGALAREKVSEEALIELQQNFLLSHAVGLGNLIPKDITRLMLQLKIVSLAQGYSGVSKEVFEQLVCFEQRGLVPAVPSKGSLGASGDLAPLAHLCLPLIGEGVFWDEAGTSTEPAKEVLKREGLDLVQLKAKDGLALVNGTQMMCAYGVYILEKSAALAKVADLIAAISLEALQGSIKPFDERIFKVRPHPGHGLVSENIRNLLADSEILQSHANCGKVQDPYSLRCVPQVHGASRDALVHATEVLNREVNSVSDNPLVFENGDIVSGGNFHGQPLALALDYAALALAEFANISERRTYFLVSGHDGLPKFLINGAGVNSGFMIPQYTAASLVSENKVLAHPASVDSITSSLGQEDHVSMGSISALKLLEIYQNVENVLAIELLTAGQALDFRAPLKPGKGVEIAHSYIRKHVQHRDKDRLFTEDLESARRIIQDRSLLVELRNNGIDLN